MGQGRAMATRTLMPFERDEHDPALVGSVTVVERVATHAAKLPRLGKVDIGASP